MEINIEELPKKTREDHEYLKKHGWRYIGRKRSKYGWHYYWDFYQDNVEGGCWSKQYIQGDAIYRQKQIDKQELKLRQN